MSQSENRQQERNYILWLLLMLSLTVMALQYGPVTYHLRTYKSALVMLYSFLFLIWLVLHDAHTGDRLDRRGTLILLLLFLHAMYTYIVALCTENAYDSEYYLGTLIALLAWSYATWRCSKRMANPRLAWLGPTPLFIILGIWAGSQFLTSNAANRFEFTLSFGNVNFFACYLAGFVPFLLAGVFQPGVRTEWRVGIFLGFASAILCLLGTQSRGGLGGATLGIILFFACYFFVLRKRTSRLPAFLYFGGSVLVVALLLVTLWLTAPFILRRAVQFATNLEYEAVTRVTPWIAAVGMWEERPIFGHGLGCFYRNVFRFVTDISGYSHTLSFRHTHNEYLELLADGGIVGFVWWMGVIVYVLWKLWGIVRDHNRDYTYRLMACGVLCGFVGIMCHYGVDEASRTSTSMTAFYFLLGLALWLFEKEYGVWRPGVAWHVSLAIFLIAAVASLAIFRCFMADRCLVKAIQQQQFADRIAYLEEGLRYRPDNVYVTNEMCQSYYRTHQIDKAFQWALRIDEIIPGYRDNNLFLAVCYADRQRFTEAWQKLTFFQKIYPYKDQGYFVGLYVAKQQGRRDIYQDNANKFLRAVVTAASTAYFHVAVPNVHICNDMSALPPGLAEKFVANRPGYVRQDKSLWVYVPAALVEHSIQEMWQLPAMQQPTGTDRLRKKILRQLQISDVQSYNR